MKKIILTAALVCLFLPGCEDLFNEPEKEKTAEELRAERNKPIYEQFIGEWDEYDDENLTIKREPIVVSDTEFELIGSYARHFVTNVNYSNIIYTLEECRNESGYPVTAASNDLDRDGFIKLKRVYENNFDFLEYHFYNADKFSLKLVTAVGRFLNGEGGISYYKRAKTGEGGSGDTVDLPGDYGLTAGAYNCTLTFNNDGTYEFIHPVGSNVRSGTWSQSGGEVTMTYNIPGSETISEVFITTEAGNVVTLTLKDSSAGISNILASFNLAATSVSLTKN
jgi:hypothetical protein